MRRLPSAVNPPTPPCPSALHPYRIGFIITMSSAALTVVATLMYAMATR